MRRTGSTGNEASALLLLFFVSPQRVCQCSDEVGASWDFWAAGTMWRISGAAAALGASASRTAAG